MLYLIIVWKSTSLFYSNNKPVNLFLLIDIIKKSVSICHTIQISAYMNMNMTMIVHKEVGGNEMKWNVDLIWCKYVQILTNRMEGILKVIG